MKTQTLRAALAACVLAAAPAVYAQDDCASPLPISGNGLFPFDLSTATPSGQAVAPQCVPNLTTLGRDVWFCWTATCTGIVTVSTCDLTQGDTILAMYPADLGCSCPGDRLPICCNDDACGKQSSFTCEVVCGQRYMIQVATRPGQPGFGGELRIACEGKPCDANPEPIECDCAGGRPPLVDNLTTPFNPGLVAVATNYVPFAAGEAVWLIDLGGQGAAPLGSNWATSRYSHPSWTMGNLGAVFGVTLDDAGNIYVAHSSAYLNFGIFVDPVGFGGAGAVYRLDGSTGATTLVLQLPQQLDPALPAGEQYAGLGQLSYDPSTQRLFASNFEDGRVYAIDPSNGAGFKVRSTFRHGGAITWQLPDANLADPTDSAGFEPLGKRIWAVKATRGRLYYSLWVEDSARPDAAQANQVWSVAYNAGGELIAGSERKEFDVPPRVGSNYSNPIADITFDGNCCMLVAERSMTGDSSTGAHDARTMRFCQDKSGAWQLDTVLLTGAFGSGENSAGGIGYEGIADQVWSMGDAIRLDSVAIYGLQGQAAAGAPVANSILVDLDGSISQGQKTQLGSIDVNCVFIRDCEFDTIDIDCKPQADGSMDFLWTVSITNNSPSVANILILSDPAFAPNNVILLDAPVAPGNKIVLDIPINGGTPGEQFCFFATLASSTGNECCTEEICIELPDCECFDSDVAVRDLPGNGSFEVNLSITNLEPFAAEWITVAVSPAGAGSVNPSLVNIPTTPQFTTVATGPLTINTTAAPGTPLTLIVGMHAQTFHPCCFVEIVVVVPANAGNQVPGDIDGDGTVNATDLAILFNNWGGAGATDLNGDGVTNGQDLAILLSNWG